jgi:DNA polymerase III psi subunit
MKLNPGQLSALTEMGISVWELRPAAEPKPSFAAEQQPRTVTADIDMSAAIWLLLPSLNLSQPEQKLLTTMLKAIKLDMTSVALLGSNQLSLLDEAVAADKIILVLDAGLAGKLSANQAEPQAPTIYPLPVGASMIASFSLSDMMQSPSLKASAWQALKLARSAF